jgi:AraC-like DNA-binding protein
MNNKAVSEIMEGNVVKEVRTFVNTDVPINIHVDIMVNTPHHYVHKHRDMEFLMGLSGNGVVYTDMKSHDICCNRIIVVNTNKIHYVTSDNVFKYYCLQIDSDYLSSLGMDVEEMSFCEEIADEELCALMHRLYEEWKEDCDLRSVMIKSLINEFVIKLYRKYKATDSAKEKESRTLKKVKQSISFIKKNYTRDITLDEIASVAGFSRYHFCREFKKATDLTPIEFINRMRCEYAKTLLETQNYSVAEISTMVGFSTSAHFSKIFKRFFSSYPSEYVKSSAEAKGGDSQ